MSNIVHFGKYFHPDSGGIESVTFALSVGAVEVGHSVTVICFDKAGSRSCEDDIQGVRVVRAPIFKVIASQPFGFRYILRCFESLRAANIIHLHAPNILASLVAIFSPKKVRLLVHWHSDVVNKGFLGKLVKPIEKTLLRRADLIVATSQVYADASEVLSSFEDKVCVIPIGVSDRQLADGFIDPPDFIVKKAQGRKIILSVGRLVPYKGFEYLIEAAKFLSNDCLVVIVGAGPLMDDLQSSIEAHKVSDRVILAGRLSDGELDALFRSAYLYCMPSTYRAEAFGVVLVEAMSYGLPIVATEIEGSGVPWVNKHGESGINVPVESAEALSEACNLIIHSTELHGNFSRGARCRFLTEFTEKNSIRKMMSAYSRLIGDVR